VDSDLLTGGDGDLGFLCPASFSSAISGLFGIISFSVDPEGIRDLPCLPEEQLVA